MQEKESPRKTQDAPAQHSDFVGTADRLGRNTHVWPSVRHDGEGEATASKSTLGEL